MKKIYVIAAIALLASCSHNQVDTHPNMDRLPSSTTEVMSCGLLGTTETSRNAVDVNFAEKIDDRLYSLQIDCNKDSVVNLEKEHLIVGVPMSQVKPAQKSWITRWSKRAIRTQHNPAAKPYVCMTYQASYDPCTANKNVYGVAPRFSSKVLVGKKVK